MDKKIYCGCKDVPKNKRLGTLQECFDINQTRYYGITSDKKLLELIKTSKQNQEYKVKVTRINKKLKDLSYFLVSAETESEVEDVVNEIKKFEDKKKVLKIKNIEYQKIVIKNFKKNKKEFDIEEEKNKAINRGYKSKLDTLKEKNESFKRYHEKKNLLGKK